MQHFIVDTHHPLCVTRTVRRLWSGSAVLCRTLQDKGSSQLCDENQDVPLLTWLPSQQFGQPHSDTDVFASQPQTHPRLSCDTFIITFAFLLFRLTHVCISVTNSIRNRHSCLRGSRKILLSLSVEWKCRMHHCCFCLKQNERKTETERKKFCYGLKVQYTKLYCYRGP